MLPHYYDKFDWDYRQDQMRAFAASLPLSEMKAVYGVASDQKVIDLSYHNGVVDFDQIANDGVTYVIIKAGGADIGKPYADPMFAKNYAAAQKRFAGRMAAYWFASPFVSIEDQAAVFRNFVSDKNLDLCIDIEWPVRGASSEHLSTMLPMFNLVEKWANGYPMIYSAAWWMNPLFDKADTSSIDWARMRSWGASYTAQPISFKPFSSLMMWQYTSSGSVKGVSGNVDMNIVFDENIFKPIPKERERLPDVPFKAKTTEAVNGMGNSTLTGKKLYEISIPSVEVDVHEVDDKAQSVLASFSMRAWIPIKSLKLSDTPPKPEPPPLPDPPPLPPNKPVRIGYNVLGGDFMSRADAGTRFFMVQNMDVARAIKRKYKDAIVMVRWYHKDRRIEPIDAIRAFSPSMDDELVFTLFNENEAYGYHTAEDIRIRAEKDIQFAEMIRARSPRSVCALGGFSSGEPFIDSDTHPRSLELREAFRRYYSTGYNQGQYGMNFHTYTPTLTTGMNQYYASRWRFLFSHCGFDPKSPSRIYSGETGVDTGLIPSGANGFIGINANQAEVSNWIARFKEAQSQPVAGVPSPYAGGAIFCLGENADSRWKPFKMDSYTTVS